MAGKFTRLHKTRKIRRHELLIFVVIIFVLLSGLNYAIYNHRLNAIDVQAAAVYYGHGVNEPLSALESIDIGQRLTIKKHKYFVSREVIFSCALLCR